ncbi:hypothetical protein HD806DRAFT_522712 [Xylariaceae sp. AK1471]|nr:hypothetical protein HD806DRAFT_522712 [Xylariaceae sp. AK1471]
MPATPRQKACNACADSKRRCDKQLPECQRCLDRDLDCVYPKPHKRRRTIPIARDTQAGELPALETYAGADADADTLENSLNAGDWAAMDPGAADLDIYLSDVMVPYIPTLPDSTANLSAQGFAPNNDNFSHTPCPWFLRGETWVMHHGDDEPACVPTADLEPFIRAVEDMLQCWVKSGSNSFIHRRLYEKGMPTCLQDAFTTLAAYTARTPAVKETILQIAEERASALVHQSLPTAVSAQGILTHLAHVQALFVYLYIGLFDGSVHRRASAEQQTPTLRRWVMRMLETVRRYRGEDSPALPDRHDPLPRASSEFDKEYKASSEMWQLWILAESVRRTHLVIDTVLNIYQVFTRGWAECTGAVMVTARRGLWEAESALKWFHMCCEKPPLLVPSLQPGPLISQYAAEEIDSFATLFWTYIIDKDRFQSWVDRGNKTSRAEPDLEQFLAIPVT